MSADTHESQEKASDSVQLASQTVVNHFMVLEWNPGPRKGQQVVLAIEPSLWFHAEPL